GEVRQAPAVGQAGDEREGEGECLTRAGAATTEDVPAAERVRQRGRLDGEGGGDAGVGQVTDDGVRKVERSEGGQGDLSGVMKGRSSPYRNRQWLLHSNSTTPGLPNSGPRR